MQIEFSTSENDALRKLQRNLAGSSDYVRKTTEVPCEADASGQKEFTQELSSLLKENDETTVVYYADGVHPTRNSRSTYAGTEKGEELPQPTVSGRERVNVNGLLNAYDVTDMIARDCDSVNAQSTRVLYEAAFEQLLKRTTNFA